jgi:AraC-like DNA-binding protein
MVAADAMAASRGDTSARALEHSVAFTAGDPADARARTQQLLTCTHRMTLLEREPPFRARVEHAAMAGLGLMWSTYGAPVEISCAPPVQMVSVSFVLHGRIRFEHDGGEQVIADARTAAALSYNRPIEMRWTPGARQLLLCVEKARIEEYLRRLISGPLRDPLRVETAVDLRGRARGIASAVATMHHAMAQCGKAGPPPVLAAELEHNVLSALLLGHRHNYTDTIFSPTRLPSPRIVRRVVELIESSAEASFTVADLAAFAGVSERSLYAAFRRQLGISPMAYVRLVRLERAHEELLSLEPSRNGTVTDVALRHGFAHTGRFAAAYRARFGESPSQTLRR